MEGGQEPFPTMLFVNEAFAHNMAMGLPVTEDEMEQNHAGQSDDFSLQNSTQRVKTEGGERGNSWCRLSNQEYHNDNSERERKCNVLKDFNQINYESEIIQVDKGSIVPVNNGTVNIEIKQEIEEEGCYFIDYNISNQMKSESEIRQIDSSNMINCEWKNTQVNTDSVKPNAANKVVKAEINEEKFALTDDSEIKVEIDVCSEFESNVLFPMKSVKKENQASFNNCVVVNLENEEEKNDVLVVRTTSHTSNTDGNGVIHHCMPLQFDSSEQEKLEACVRSFVPTVVVELAALSVGDTDNSVVPISSMSNFQGDSAETNQMYIKQCHFHHKQFNHSGNLKKHLLNPTPDKPHKCPVCGKAFRLRRYMKTHMLRHEGVKPYKCTVCDKAFRDKGHMKTHIKGIHEGVKPHKCKVCDKAFTLRAHMKSHMFVHGGVKPHKCTLCDKSFTLQTSMNRHMLIHEGVKPYKCTVCEKAFRDRGTMKTHMMLHEGVKPHKCTVCEKAFTHKRSMKTHMLHHEGVKPHKCTVCDRAFTQRGTMKTHIKLVHEGGKPHKCTVCNKAFSLRGHMKTHMLIHGCVKPYECSVCYKAFLRRGDMKKHMMIHEGVVKPHKCAFCDKAYRNKVDMKKHMLIHEDVKPHKCTVCDKVFTDEGNLKRHNMLLHEGVKPHKCTICDKAFTHRGTMKTHIMLIHKSVKPH